MHPHLKEARAGHESKLSRLSGAHGTAALPSGNKPTKHEVASGPQKAVGMTAEGGKPKANLGKFARGGRARHKGKGTNVNVIVAPHGGGAPGPMPMPMPPGAGMMPPRPPMPAPMPPPPGGAPGMAPPGMPPGMPPGLPPHKSGGRAFARGGRTFTAGAGSGEGREEKAEAARRKGKK